MGCRVSFSKISIQVSRKIAGLYFPEHPLCKYQWFMSLQKMHLIGHDNGWINTFFFLLKDHFVPIAKNNSLLSDFTLCKRKDQYLTYFTLACYVTWSLWGSEVILLGLCMFKSRLLEETLTLKMRTSLSLSEGGEGEEHWSWQVSSTILLPRILAQTLFIAGEVKIKVPLVWLHKVTEE